MGTPTPSRGLLGRPAIRIGWPVERGVNCRRRSPLATGSQLAESDTPVDRSGFLSGLLPSRTAVAPPQHAYLERAVADFVVTGHRQLLALAEEVA